MYLGFALILIYYCFNFIPLGLGNFFIRFGPFFFLNKTAALNFCHTSVYTVF